MAGALAERAFADKLERAGFDEILIGERRAFGIDDVASYPLFTPELVSVMRRTIPPERQGCVATAVIARGRKTAS
ncbi:MAG: hypothetical protein M3314_12140 [Actinomycetota bacterium]|nr:hypothetical protein [Actinomycetota bacterium]